MLRRSSANLAPWLLLLLLLTYPQMGQLQDMPGLFGRLSRIAVNLINLLTGSLTFFGHDVRMSVRSELKDSQPEKNSTFDFIVIGAGSAGAVVASRLSEAQGAKVLLIEAGPEETAINDIPLLALYLQFDRKINWNYAMEPSKDYCRGMINNSCLMPRGKVTGGSSVLNLMIATRSNRRQFDHWAKGLGCKGWSWDDVLPIFRRMEHFEPTVRSAGNRYHGHDGPLNIALPPFRTRSADTFLKASKELGYSLVDYMGKEQMGYSYLYGTVNNGSRISSNRAYLYPARTRDNLFLTKESKVNKILIHPVSKRAYGVSFTKNRERFRVFAKKEVILCAGAINSPQLLMLSGIGPREHLKSLKIPVIKDAPVGENLMDHISYWGLNFLVNDTVTMVTRDLFRVDNPAIPDYLTKRQGPMTTLGGAEAIGFINVYDKQAKTGIPNMELLFAGVSVGSDPLFYKALNLKKDHYQASFANVLNRQSFTVLPTLLTPKSRGRVSLRPGNKYGPPVIEPKYFDEPEDMEVMILGIREAIRLTEARVMDKYNVTLVKNPIIGCESYRYDSDQYWECAVRTFASTLHHPAGTCKMGHKTDRTAVVNPKLQVIGVKNLRVADASIMPEIVTGHTNVPSMMIGEKLADMVKKDWNLG